MMVPRPWEGLENYIADIIPSASESGRNEEINDDPLPTTSNVIGASALVRCIFANVKDRGLCSSDPLGSAEKCLLSQVARLFKQKMQDYFMRSKKIESEVKAEVDAATEVAKTGKEVPLEELYADIYVNPLRPNVRGTTPFTEHKHLRITNPFNLK